jgi:spore maturation protein CgeB
MNKIMEYMALRKPIVQYNLKEGRFSAMESSLYAECGDTIDFATKMMQLIDNPGLRKRMAEYGYNRVINELSWDYESVKLTSFYHRIFMKGSSVIQKQDIPQHTNTTIPVQTRQPARREPEPVFFSQVPD